jgi:hypothetical protein
MVCVDAVQCWCVVCCTRMVDGGSSMCAGEAYSEDSRYVNVKLSR